MLNIQSDGRDFRQTKTQNAKTQKKVYREGELVVDYHPFHSRQRSILW